MQLKSDQLDDSGVILYDGKFRGYQGIQKSFEIRIIPLIAIKKVITLLYDTTERDQLVSLEYSNQYKDSLLASVTHELRTPLNGNLSMIDTVLQLPDVADEIK